MNQDNHSNGVAPQEPNGAGGAGYGGGSGPGDSAILRTAEERHAHRWRRAILRLSEAFMDAADERRDLSPILLEALHNALDNLLVYGEAGDLMVLEEWLAMEEESTDATWRQERRESDRRGHDRRFAERRFADRRYRVVVVQSDRRELLDRRAVVRRMDASADRRQASRRAPRDWQFEDIQVAGG